MKENKMFFKTENLQKLIGRPVIAMALDHPLLKKYLDVLLFRNN